jgi:transposase InsO family protein
VCAVSRVRKATARAVTQALYEEDITRFGCAVTVISDNGTQYSGGTFPAPHQELGIAHRLTPSYTPQANPVERTNKTLKIMVAQFWEADQKKWDARLRELIFALNTSRQESTRYTPALLNFGRDLVVPKAIHRPAPGDITTDPPADTADNETDEADDAVHHSERLRLLNDTFELVRVNLARAFANRASIITFVTGRPLYQTGPSSVVRCQRFRGKASPQILRPVHRHESPLSSGVQPPIALRTEDPPNTHKRPEAIPSARTSS